MVCPVPYLVIVSEWVTKPPRPAVWSLLAPFFTLWVRVSHYAVGQRGSLLNFAPLCHRPGMVSLCCSSLGASATHSIHNRMLRTYAVVAFLVRVSGLGSLLRSSLWCAVRVAFAPRLPRWLYRVHLYTRKYLNLSRHTKKFFMKVLLQVLAISARILA